MNVEDLEKKRMQLLEKYSDLIKEQTGYNDTLLQAYVNQLIINGEKAYGANFVEDILKEKGTNSIVWLMNEVGPLPAAQVNGTNIQDNLDPMYLREQWVKSLIKANMTEKQARDFASDPHNQIYYEQWLNTKDNVPEPVKQEPKTPQLNPLEAKKNLLLSKHKNLICRRVFGGHFNGELTLNQQTELNNILEIIIKNGELFYGNDFVNEIVNQDSQEVVAKMLRSIPLTEARDYEENNLNQDVVTKDEEISPAETPDANMMPIEPIEENIDNQITEPIEENIDNQITEPIEINTDNQITEPIEINTDNQITEPIEINADNQITEPIETNTDNQVTEPIEINADNQVTEPIDVKGELINDIPETAKKGKRKKASKSLISKFKEYWKNASFKKKLLIGAVAVGAVIGVGAVVATTIANMIATQSFDAEQAVHAGNMANNFINNFDVNNMPDPSALTNVDVNTVDPNAAVDYSNIGQGTEVYYTQEDAINGQNALAGNEWMDVNHLEAHDINNPSNTVNLDGMNQQEMIDTFNNGDYTVTGYKDNVPMGHFTEDTVKEAIQDSTIRR